MAEMADMAKMAAMAELAEMAEEAWRAEIAELVQLKQCSGSLLSFCCNAIVLTKKRTVLPLLQQHRPQITL